MLKISNGQIILFDESDLEALPPIDTFDTNDRSRIIESTFWQDTSDCVSSVDYSFKDPMSGQLVQVEWTPPNPPKTGQALKINKRPGNLEGDAMREMLGGTPIEMVTFSSAKGFAGSKGSGDGKSVSDFADIRADAMPVTNRESKALARDKNKHEWNGDVMFVGDPRIRSGVTLNIIGEGVYDGKYIIDATDHDFSDGWIIRAKMHRVLVGY
jgi:hypothetical protein